MNKNIRPPDGKRLYNKVKKMSIEKIRLITKYLLIWPLILAIYIQSNIDLQGEMKDYILNFKK